MLLPTAEPHRPPNHELVSYRWQSLPPSGPPPEDQGPRLEDWPDPQAPTAEPMGTDLSTRPTQHALLAGGRSGGHVFPALAVAQELLGRKWKVSFTGGEAGLEARLSRERGIPFYPLPARPVVGRRLWSQLGALWVLGRGALKAWALIRRLKAEVVLGTGGYVSAPAVVGARLARRRAFLLEPNAQVGTANRWLSWIAHGAAVAYEDARDQLHCPTWVTGVPVRQEFFAVQEELPDISKPRLLVLGGSQGARELNCLLPSAVAAAARRHPNLRVLHQTGELHVKETQRSYGEALEGEATAGSPSQVTVEVVPFLSHVATAMANSHLIISRAGAVTLAEICAAGRPALLVPLKLAGGHQRRNAEALERAGAGLVLPQELTAAVLADTVGELLADPARLQRMGRSARSLARPDAPRVIADHLETMAGKVGSRP